MRPQHYVVLGEDIVLYDISKVCVIEINVINIYYCCY